MGSKKFVVANHKMSLMVEDLPNYLAALDGVQMDQVIICPTSLYLPYFLKQGYQVGLQNVYHGEKETCTGEIAPAQALQMGITTSLIGHSDRRISLGETEAMIHQKVRECLKHRLKVILCIGETKEERSMLKTEAVLKKQMTSALSSLDQDELSDVMIAYEPVWAVGTNQVPTNKDIEAATSYIKRFILAKYHVAMAVLYGGSIDENNITEINKISSLNGVLVGGSSLDARKFLHIIEVVVSQ